MSHLRFAHLPLAAALLATPTLAQTWDIAPLVVEGDALAGGFVNTIRNLAINDSLDWRVEAQLQVSDLLPFRKSKWIKRRLLVPALAIGRN